MNWGISWVQVIIMSSRYLLKAQQIKNFSTTKAEELLNDGDGLKLRVRASGAKDWFYLYRRPNEKNITKISLGSYPTIPLEKARKLAEECREQRANGIDPKIVREEIERQKAVAQLEQASLPRTVNELFSHWKNRELSKRKDGGAEIDRAFNKDVLPVIGNFMLTEVRKGHISAILDEIVDRGSNRMANRTLSDLRQMFGFAISRDWVDNDPTSRLEKSDFGGKETPRERNLLPHEVKELWHKLPVSKLSIKSQYAVWIMLSTLCRVGEISRARWQDIDLNNKTWLIPDEHAKNGKAHLIHLSDFALFYFEKLKETQISPLWVFASRNQSEQHLDEKTIQKQIRDRQRINPLKGRTQNSQTLVLSGGEWTVHDLRRTGATLMGELGISSEIIDRCQNHLEPNKIKRTYQRQKALEDRKNAFNLLGEHLSTIIHEDNILHLKFGGGTA